jgi:hypothetical protein
MKKPLHLQAKGSGSFFVQLTSWERKAFREQREVRQD